MGYTPVFSDIYMGTLYGRWPAAAVWASILPLLDKNGVLDVSPQAISGMTGWPLDLLQQGLAQLMEPDPSSRTANSDGRRLVLLDPARPWGWRAVNHGKYREKARKAAYDAVRAESGENADRMRKRRETREDPTRPDATREHPLSNANANANTNKEEEKRADALPPDLDKQAWEIWLAYRAEIKKPIKPASMAAAQRKLAGFGADQAAVVEQSIAQGWTGLFSTKGDTHAPNSRKPTRLEQSQRELERWARERGVDPATI